MKHFYENDAKRQGHYFSFHKDSGQILIYTPDGGLLAAVADDEVARRTVAKLDLGTPDLDTLGRYLRERNEAQTQAEQHLRERECMRELRDELLHERIELMNQIQKLRKNIEMHITEFAPLHSKNQELLERIKHTERELHACNLRNANQADYTRQVLAERDQHRETIKQLMDVAAKEKALAHPPFVMVKDGSDVEAITKLLDPQRQRTQQQCQDQVAKDITKLNEDLRIARIEAQQMREAYENLRTQRDAEVTGVEGDRLRRDLGMAQAVNGKLTSDLAHRDAVLGQIRNLLEEDDE